MQRLTADEHTKSIQSSAADLQVRHWLVPDLGRPINKLDDLLELASHLPPLGHLEHQGRKRASAMQRSL